MFLCLIRRDRTVTRYLFRTFGCAPLYLTGHLDLGLGTPSPAFLVREAMSEDVIPCCLSIMRRMPPDRVTQSLGGLLRLVPDAADELLQRVDQPLVEAKDPDTGRKYLLCDYNRDGDSYRSPWSNKYFPPLEDVFYPSDSLRALEMEANELFDIYRDQYYEGGTSSVYLWDLEGNGFAGCFAIKKEVADHRFVKAGSWDSIHVLEASTLDGKSFTYKLTTTVMLSMAVDNAEVGDTNLSGSVTRQSESSGSISKEQTHMSNIGRLIEDMEISLRSDLDALYIQKTNEVINSIRSLSQAPRQDDSHIKSLIGAVSKHGVARKIDSEV